MLDLNRLTLIGNVSKEPKTGKTGRGDSYATFTICASHQFDKAGREQNEKIELEVFAWNGLADWIAGNVKRGTRLYVEGRLRMRTKPSGMLDGSIQIPELVASQVIPYHSETKIPKGQDIKPTAPPMNSEDGIHL